MTATSCAECDGTGKITRKTPGLGVIVHERCAACQGQGERQADTMTDGGES